MARQIKIVSIGENEDKKEFMIKELRVKDILDIFEDFNSLNPTENKTEEKEGESSEIKTDDISLASFFEKFVKILPKVTNATIDDLKTFAPSEIKILWEAFVEVNTVFFEFAQKMGISDVVDGIRQTITNDLQNLFADSLSQGI